MLTLSPSPYRYNGTHLHSGICFVTPNDCHSGRAQEILQNRNRIIAEEQQRLGRIIRTGGYKLPEKVGLMSFAVKRKQIANNVKQDEYKRGSKAA